MSFKFAVPLNKRRPKGYESKFNHQGTAGVSPCFHLPGFHFGTGSWSHSIGNITSGANGRGVLLRAEAPGALGAAAPAQRLRGAGAGRRPKRRRRTEKGLVLCLDGPPPKGWRFSRVSLEALFEQRVPDKPKHWKQGKETDSLVHYTTYLVGIQAPPCPNLTFTLCPEPQKRTLPQNKPHHLAPLP